MHLIFLLARTYPWWAVPMALVFGQITIYFWRKQSPVRFLFAGATLSMIVGAVLWIVFRGDLNSDRWVRALLIE